MIDYKTCRMDPWSFLSWFHIRNRSTFELDMRKKTILNFFLHFHPQWPINTDLKFAHLVTLVQRYVSTELEVSMGFVFRENRGRTDGRGATLNGALWW